MFMNPASCMMVVCNASILVRLAWRIAYGGGNGGSSDGIIAARGQLVGVKRHGAKWTRRSAQRNNAK